LDPRIPEKIARRGAFIKGMDGENLLKWDPYSYNKKTTFINFFLVHGLIVCASLRAFHWYLGIQNCSYGRLAN